MFILISLKLKHFRINKYIKEIFNLIPERYLKYTLLSLLIQNIHIDHSYLKHKLLMK
jgi:hypothetical protein